MPYSEHCGPTPRPMNLQYQIPICLKMRDLNKMIFRLVFFKRNAMKFSVAYIITGTFLPGCVFGLLNFTYFDIKWDNFFVTLKVIKEADKVKGHWWKIPKMASGLVFLWQGSQGEMGKLW